MTTSLLHTSLDYKWLKKQHKVIKALASWTLVVAWPAGWKVALLTVGLMSEEASLVTKDVHLCSDPALPLLQDT